MAILRSTSAALACVVCASLLATAAPAGAQDIGLNGMARDTWLPLTVEGDAPLPRDHALYTDDCRYDSRLPRAFDQDALRTADTAPVITVPRPGPGGPDMESCGVTAAEGVELPERLSLGSYVLFDVDSGEVLAAKDPYGLYRPASIIKILLVMVALDELDLDQLVPVTSEMANVDGSKVGIGPGGRYTVEKLLQGLVMNSGNDAALALAEALGGADATIAKMQSLADSLGASATRVTTVNGLDTPGTQATAYDLALVYQAAFHREDVTTLLGIRQTAFPGYKEYPTFDISSDNGLLWDYPGAIGGKTGFTDNARHTYAGAATRDGRTLAVVLLNSTIAAGRPWAQAEQLLDSGFAAPRGTNIGALVDQTGTVTNSASGSIQNDAEDASPNSTDSTDTSASPMASRLIGPAMAVVLGVVILTLTGAWWLSLRRRR